MEEYLTMTWVESERLSRTNWERVHLTLSLTRKRISCIKYGGLVVERKETIQARGATCRNTGRRHREY